MRGPEECVQDFNLAGTGLVELSRPTEKEVGVFVGSFGGTSTRVREGGGGVSRLILPKMTFGL